MWLYVTTYLDYTTKHTNLANCKSTECIYYNDKGKNFEGIGIWSSIKNKYANVL